MTDREAINRIKEHIRIHQTKEPRAVKITEALNKAVQALEKNIELDSPQRIKGIRFRTQQGEIMTGFLDTSTQIVYFNYITMDFIKDVLGWEEVKNERETESEE